MKKTKEEWTKINDETEVLYYTLNETEKQIIKFLQKRGGKAPLISIKRNFFPESWEDLSRTIKDMKEKKIIEVRPYGEFDVLNAFLVKKYNKDFYIRRLAKGDPV
jgi:hypothetical protein